MILSGDRTPPLLERLPLYPSIAALPGITAADMLLYGVIAAYQDAGHEPSLDEIAAITRTSRVGSDHKATRRRIAKLEAIGVLRREHAGGQGVRLRFVLLVPQLPGTK